MKRYLWFYDGQIWDTSVRAPNGFIDHEFRLLSNLSLRAFIIFLPYEYRSFYEPARITLPRIFHNKKNKK